MPTQFKLPILWSIRTNPAEIRKMVQHIDELIVVGKFRCRIGFSPRYKHPHTFSEIVIDPREPNGIISDLYWNETGWYGDVFVIERWTDMVSEMKDPVLHPLIVTDNITHRIVYFVIMERSDVNRDRTYDGVNYKDTLEDFDGDIIDVLLTAEEE